MKYWNKIKFIENLVLEESKMSYFVGFGRSFFISRIYLLARVGSYRLMNITLVTCSPHNPVIPNGEIQNYKKIKLIYLWISYHCAYLFDYLHLICG